MTDDERGQLEALARHIAAPAPQPRAPRSTTSLSDAVDAVVESLRATASARAAAPPARAPRAPAPGDIDVYAERVGRVTLARARVSHEWTGCGRPECCDGWVRVEDDRGYAFAARCEVCGGLVARVEAFNRACLPGASATTDLADVGDGGSLDWARLDATVVARVGLRSYLRTWLDGWEPGGVGVMLYGATGTGKTHIACGLVRHLTIRRGVTCRYVYWPDFLSAVKRSWDGDGREDDLFHALCSVDVLVFDEMRGAGGNAEWAVERAERVAEMVVADGKTAIITTNLSPHTDNPREGLIAGIGARAHSRMLGATTVVDVIASDYRRRGGSKARTNASTPALLALEPQGCAS